MEDDVCRVASLGKFFDPGRISPPVASFPAGSAKNSSFAGSYASRHKHLFPWEISFNYKVLVVISLLRLLGMIWLVYLLHLQLKT
ncbi:MAG: hypothetical protein OEV89_11005 [Desulfobulbaceae bacterium]|nr:hypothetical protein [Desulfobulbaceae bacterium]HIJ91217.1 hypothetical protein [Deltaproteobacteria bacterium]